MDLSFEWQCTHYIDTHLIQIKQIIIIRTNTKIEKKTMMRLNRRKLIGKIFGKLLAVGILSHNLCVYVCLYLLNWIPKTSRDVCGIKIQELNESLIRIMIILSTMHCSSVQGTKIFPKQKWNYAKFCTVEKMCDINYEWSLYFYMIVEWNKKVFFCFGKL